MKKVFCLALACLSVAQTQTAPGAATTPPGAEQVATQFVSRLVQQEFQKAAATFDATMAKALTSDQLMAIWTEQLKAVGTCRKIERARLDLVPPYRVVFVTCQFEKGQMDVKVVIDKEDRVAGLFFLPTQVEEYHPPVYVRRSAFKEDNVLVGAGKWSLPGKLSMPLGKGPFPALVLVHGSGPQDSDESIGPNKPFRDLAWGLASQGIAVLRYEKRTKQYAARLAESMEGFTVKEEVTEDALEAVSVLRKTEGIDSNRVFVLGHSLGGMLVPRIAAAEAGIAGFVVMAGAARPLEDLLLEQTLYQTSLVGELSADQKNKVEALSDQVAAVKKLSKESPVRGQLLGAPVSYWLDLQGYEPAAQAKTLNRSMLILQGNKDCQVNPREDFERWQQALSDRKDVTFKTYPVLNHLFMVVNGKSTGAEYQVTGHVDEVVVSDIAAWVKQH